MNLINTKTNLENTKKIMISGAGNLRPPMTLVLLVFFLRRLRDKPKERQRARQSNQRQQIFKMN